MAKHSHTLTGSELVAVLSAPGVPVLTNRLTELVDVTLEAPHGISGILTHGKCDGAEVAVRVIKVLTGSNSASYQALQIAADELKFWLQLRHDNIVPLLGLACIQGQAALVSPWAHNGRIFTFLNKHHSVNRLKLCAQLASAVAYLHSKGIVHQNIQAKNVLVSQNGNVKLVGLGTIVLKDIGHHGDRITESDLRLRWTAPEIYVSPTRYNTASDVWALGMTILEVMTTLPPFATMRSDRDAMAKVISRGIPARPTELAGHDQLWALLVRCWSYDPQNRPSAAAVYDALRRMA